MEDESYRNLDYGDEGASRSPRRDIDFDNYDRGYDRFPDSRGGGRRGSFGARSRGGRGRRAAFGGPGPRFREEGWRGGRGGGRGPPRGGFRSSRRLVVDAVNTQFTRNFDNSVFVGNLSFDCSVDDLREFFQPIGEIVSTDIITSGGRHKGMGTVEFTNTADVDEAIRQMDGVMFMGREIFVKQDHPPPSQSARPLDVGMGYEGEEMDRGYPRPPPRQRRLEKRPPPGGDRPMEGYEAFIVNLPYAITWQNLKDMFREAGDVSRADVELDYRGLSRGFGSVYFPIKEDMYRAIDMFNGYNLDGRILEVREGRFNYLLDEQLQDQEQIQHPPLDYPQDEEPPMMMGDYEDGQMSQGIGRMHYDEDHTVPPVPPQATEEETVPELEKTEPAPQSEFIQGVVSSGERSTLIYCSNLPVSTSINDLYELFESLGKVNKAELIFDPAGLPTGNAVIDYMDLQYADLCISKLNNYNYGGNDLSVSYAERKALE
ncbi:single-stranded telomeric DNA-binding/mRNA-binding protein KNAG_0I01230 [Huiozyma naganishii CBS 8797]|uniref:RRM domain-containing protein n=1 Tax=Huiozyma naganishii (strain ATCC MYA-139 / BCRC 22969 / CBS 8797 / KCTC 17520 / NBRC 10181 / NCYC 3082 / Yp74L-3) TaxID=1071383 RepID=J7S945_HUIN7|nr:hypothetical protein KNAG_0I01230 [Kazachstania naganishii CBS 8797]CCK71914.1 hypothetical protein KNAG_0I01230 [Kazachstania naganishii CBS 8797]